MNRLLLALVLSSLGGTILLYYLKNFFLEEKAKFAWGWAGFLERLLITYILLAFGQFWPLIPIIILIKVIYRLTGFRLVNGLVSQNVLAKGELAFDLIVSPAVAIVIGVALR
jgi:hypothetical protein